MRFLFIPALAFGLAGNAIAQSEDSVTLADYQRAASMLAYNTSSYIDFSPTGAKWLDGDKLIYKRATPKGIEFIAVDPVKKSKSAAFDQDKLAVALSASTGKSYTGSRLPFLTYDYTDNMKSILVSTGGKRYKVNLDDYKVIPDSSPEIKITSQADAIVSPDGKKAAFIKDYNLYLRDLVTGDTKQLTKEGEKDYGYATDNAGWRQSNEPVLSWSPDSKKIATFRQDQRKVGDMYLVTTNVGHPTLQSWKYPLPGDSNIAMIERLVINLENGKVIPFQIEPDPHRASLSDDIKSSGTFDDVQWSPDGSEVAFLSTSRDHKIEKFRIANTSTGEVREVFQETVPTQYESGQGGINWRYLPRSNEIIWYSEKDDWGHLYLYDAKTGKQKNVITTGDYVVTKIESVDEDNRTIIFAAVGKDPANPYYTHYFSVKFDGKHLTDLTPETGDHRVNFSPSGKYFTDTYSQPSVPGITVLRNREGKMILPLEKTDISRLVAAGWQAPKSISVKAADGKTAIYGIMFTPLNFDSTKKYPIVNYIYPGPQGGSVGSWSFSTRRSDHQALAELGFVVVLLEGTSNPLRSKSFHDMNYGNIAENTLPDQIAGIRQLAARHSFMDTSRIGVWGHSGGGFATAAAMFRYPDFYKVGISESGNHDNRNYEDDWGERYIGLLKKDNSGSDNYEAQANQNYAKNLKGKLLLAHGLMDDNVPPYNTLLVIEALEKANKDYDLIVFPNARHGYGTYLYYMMRRRWDYFVENLLGKKHPKEFDIEVKNDRRTVR